MTDLNGIRRKSDATGEGHRRWLKWRWATGELVGKESCSLRGGEGGESGRDGSQRVYEQVK